MALEELIEKCKNEDRKAQGELYTLFSNKLYAVCLKYSRNAEEAQDNLQDAFLTIFKSIGQFKFKGSFEGWIKRITVNTVLQKYRKERFFEIVNEELLEEPEVEIDEQSLSLDFLLRLIQELPDRYRMVFNLYVLDDYSHQEVAEMLEITVGTSKSNLARARMILKNKIEESKPAQAKSN
ncbi:RNA polymerase sigma factor [Planktosalinus lacus]|uniref:DNA-directed RNA polymerase sigma-70 factor n=1 Tax=Planktosalinus lacus TaxID=1526573 RepID=A0A8J2Y4G1_9FLAO|nr:RNA polymerase sigma factor [Planktosalinus lacus]GGD79740.1 DNA-directed RNA polymerase sigma-70 factor [Planktosalinus lacus]